MKLRFKNFALLFVGILCFTELGLAQNYNMTNGSISDCSGNFYDSGGNTGGNHDYGNNELLTFTICPDSPGSQVQVTFTMFDLEDSYDFMYIYNGDNVGAPSLGAYHNGTGGPGVVTGSNATGCLTFVFDSDGSFTYDGWAAVISCTQPCQDVVAVYTGANPLEVCLGEPFSISGTATYPENNLGYTQSNATSTFEWDIDGVSFTGQTANHTISVPGIYDVNLNVIDVQGCESTNDINVSVLVSDEPTFTGTSAAIPVICLGEQNTLTGFSTETEIYPQCAPPNAGTTFLPDGTGASYQTATVVDCFAPSQTFTTAADLNSICLDIEHSYLGDLGINLECPNGQNIDLLVYSSGDNTGGEYLGSPIDDGSNTPGTGAVYCFTNTATQTMNTVAGTVGLSQTMPPGDYMPVDNFSGLVGCPMNGDWTITVTDNLGSDNGYIFEWGLDFNITPNVGTYTPTIDSEQWQADPSIVSTAGNTITVQPTSSGPACYTFEATDEFGCAYDTTVCFTVLPANDPTCGCFITWDSLYFSTVDCSNQWDGQGFIDYNANAPISGDLVIEDCEGNVTVIATGPFPAGTSSTSGLGVIQYTFNGPAYNTSPYDCEYRIYFTANSACESIQTITFPALDPPDEAGTFDQSMTGNALNTFILCDTDQFDMESLLDFNIPSGESPGIGYLVYSCPPTPPAPGDNPGADPCLEYVLSGDAITVINDGGDNDNWVLGSFNVPVDNTFYIVPMTFTDSEPTAVDGDGLFFRPDCYDLALEAMQTVQFLNPITFTEVVDCIAGTVTITLEGGYPEFYGGNFTASSLTGTSGSFVNTTATHGGDIVITGLTDGDNYSFDVVDVNGCPVTISGTYTGQEDASFTYPSNVYCQLDADPSPTITGVPGGTFSATPAGMSINAAGVIDLSASTAGATYTVQYISPDPICKDTATFDITINPNPIVTAPPASFCAGLSVDVTASGADTYSWTPATGLSATTGATVTASPASNQVYTIEGTITATGCTNTGTVTVTVNPLPTITTAPSPDPAICIGGSTNISASGAGAGGTYNWTPSTGLSATTGTSVTANPTVTTTYTVSGTDANGCINSDDIQVTVNPLPTIVVNDTSMCIGGSVAVTATGGTSYSWTGTSLSATTGNPVTASPATTANYTVSGTDANGCVNTVGFEVAVLPNAPIVASPNDTICDGGTVTISAAGGVTYTWDNGLGAGSSHDVNPTTNTTYVVTGTDAQGCVGTDDVLITVDPLPIVNAVDPQTLCAGAATEGITFSGTVPTATYSWTNTNTLIGLPSSGTGDIASFNVTNPSTGTISALIEVTPTANGCVGSPIQFTITVEPTPTVNAVGPQTLCAGEPITDMLFSGSVPGTTYSWSNTQTGIGIADSGSGNITGITSTNATSGPLTGTIEVTPSYNGCSGSPILIDITVNPIPTVIPTDDQTLCAGDATDDILFSGAVSGTTYNWVNNNTLTGLGGSGSSDILSFNTINGGATQLESQITVTPSANGCTGTANQFSIFVNPIPTVNPIGDQTLCAGDSTTAVNFSGNVGTATYNWINSNTSIGLAASGTGTIGTFNTTNSTSAPLTATITVTPSNAGCTGASIDFEIIVNPIPTVSSIDDQTLCANTPTSDVLISGPVALTNFNWSNTNTQIGLLSSGSGNITSFTALNPGTSQISGIITVTPNANGCTGPNEDFTIFVDPIPTVDPVSDTTLCANTATTQVVFTGATTGTLFNWSNDNTTIGLAASGTTQVNSFTATNPGSTQQVATITVTPVANGCTGIATEFDFIVNPLPTAFIAGTTVVCENDTDPTITITGANGLAPYDVTYNINGTVQPVVTTIGNIATITAPSTPVGTYNYNLVSVTDENGCTQGSFGTATITVNPNPTPIITGETEYCTGTTATINTTQSYSTYNWSPNGETTPSIDVTEADNPITVTVTNIYGCDATSPGFNVMENSVIIYNSTVEICQGEVATIHGINQSTNGIYTQTFSLPTGCDSTSNVELIVHPLPVMNAGDDVVDCEGTPITLNATGAPTITWSPVITNGTPFVQPVGTVVYTATGTDIYGCESSDDVQVTVNPTPTVTGVLDQTICNGEATGLVTFSGAVPGTTFNWVNNNSTIGLAGTGAGNIAAFTATNSGNSTVTAMVTVTPEANACFGTPIDFTYTVNPTPTVNPIGDQELCAGQNTASVSFSGAVTGTTYNWANTNTSIGLAASGSGTITPFATTNAGSTIQNAIITVTPVANLCNGSSEDFTITVNPTPTIQVVNDQTLCNGAPTAAVNFVGSVTGTVFNWTNNNATIGLAGAGSGNIASFNAVNAGNSQVTANIVVTPSANGCNGATEPFSYIINPTPTVNSIDDQELCAGQPTNAVNFTGSVTGTTYNWVNSTTGTGLAGSGTGNIVSFNATNATTADLTSTITVTPVAVGCTGATETFDILVNPIPNVNSLTNQILCNGEATNAVNFTGNVVGTTFNWINNNPTIGLSGSGSGNIGTFNANNPGSSPIQGQITVTPVADGCTGSNQTMTFTVNPLPNATISGNSTLCLNSASPTVTFTGSNGVAPYTFTYYINDGPNQTIVSSGSVATITVPTSVAGVYNYNLVSVQDNSTTFCSNDIVGTATVTVNALPIVDAGDDEEVCIGTQVTLTATGASSFSWMPSITNGVPFVPGLGTQTYNVTGTDANGCINSDQVDVIVNPLPVINAGTDLAICIGENVTLSGSGVGAGGTYSWNLGVVDGVPFAPGSTNLYTVTGTDANGCVNTDQVVVIVNPLPIINAGATLTGCEGDSFILTGSGAGANGTYTWTGGVTNGIPFVPVVGTTTYTVTGTDVNGCENTDDTQIFIQSHPEVSFDFVQDGNCVPVTVTFTNTSSPATVTNCVWNLDDGTVFTGCGPFTHTFTQAGTYGASLYTETAENGCGDDVYYADIIDVDPLPVASFTANPNTTTTINTLVEFNNSSVGASNYQWNFGDATTSTLINPSHTYTDESEGTYVVTLVAITPAGCTDTAVAVVDIDEELIFFVPNAFTPDKDLFNEVFQPVFTSGFDPYDFTLLIFNRWGEIVFESHDATVGWPGTYGPAGNQNICQDGVYTWVIEFKTTSTDERQRHVGHVTLIK